MALVQGGLTEDSVLIYRWKSEALRVGIGTRISLAQVSIMERVTLTQMFPVGLVVRIFQATSGREKQALRGSWNDAKSRRKCRIIRAITRTLLPTLRPHTAPQPYDFRTIHGPRTTKLVGRTATCSEREGWQIHQYHGEEEPFFYSLSYRTLLYGLILCTVLDTRHNMNKTRIYTSHHSADPSETDPRTRRRHDLLPIYSPLSR